MKPRDTGYHPEEVKVEHHKRSRPKDDDNLEEKSGDSEVKKDEKP